MASSERSTTMGNSGLNRAASGVEGFVSGIKDDALQLKDKYVQDAWIQTRDYVKANPGKAILISAAAGLLVGSFLLRRR